MVRPSFAVAAVCGVFAFAGVAAIGTANSSTSPSSPVERTDFTDPDALVRFTSGALNTYWNWYFGRLNRTYYRPRAIYWYTRPTRNACGLTLNYNAQYCSVDNSVWLDKRLFFRLLVQERQDFAGAAVLAHEWGHWIQDQLGWLAYAYRNHYWVGKELQADCYAGMFARYLDSQGFLEEGDLGEGSTLMVNIGDDRRIRRDDARAHGRPAERNEWFLEGYRTGNLYVCNGVYRKIYGG